MGQILQKFTVDFHVSGALGADLNIRWTLPSDCTLLHVSAVGSNDGDATFDLGTSSDTDGILDGELVGDENVPNEFDLDDFDGDLVADPGHDYPHFTDGTVMVLIVDFDGSDGTATEDLTIVLTFSEG